MIKITTIFAAALIGLGLAGPVVAQEHGGAEIEKQHWSFAGLFGTYDENQLQRGFQVFREVCANCHSANLLAFRNLEEEGGPTFSEAQVKALAAEYEVLDGILWILRTGAQWKDMPERYPPYQTCHRRFQSWVRSGNIENMLCDLAQDLKDRGGLDVSECFIDGTFAPAKKGALALGRPSGVKGPRSWQWQTALVFLSPVAQPVLRRMRSRS